MTKFLILCTFFIFSGPSFADNIWKVEVKDVSTKKTTFAYVKDNTFFGVIPKEVKGTSCTLMPEVQKGQGLTRSIKCFHKITKVSHSYEAVCGEDSTEEPIIIKEMSFGTPLTYEILLKCEDTEQIIKDLNRKVDSKIKEEKEVVKK